MLNKELFYAYLKDGKQLSNDSLQQLKQVVEKYPYFQSAQLILLKNRQKVNDSEFSTELKKVAITCGDRRKLFYYLNDDRYARFFVPQNEDKEKENDRTRVLLDSFLNTLDTIDEKKREEVAAEPINEWEGESIISTDYLAYLEQTDPGQSSLGNDQEAKPMKHQRLLDQFLEKSSKEDNLFLSKNREKEEACEHVQGVDNLLDDDSFLTETLAQVYIKQKKYEQALTIIKRLSLNFPEKSIYFADQIRFLEYLIYNEKNKK